MNESEPAIKPGQVYSRHENPAAPKARVYEIRNSHVAFDLVDSNGVVSGHSRLHREDFLIFFQLDSEK